MQGFSDLVSRLGGRGSAQGATSRGVVEDGRDGVFPTRALASFLDSLRDRDAPVVLDLGAVVGANVTFLGEQLGCKLVVEDLFADRDRSTQPGDHDRSTQPGDHDRSTQPGDHDRSTQPGDHDRSTQPGDHDRSTQPGDHDRSTQPGDHDRSTQPGDHDRSTQPGDHDRSTQPGDHDRSTQPGDHDRSTQPGDHDRSTQPGDHDRSTQPGDHDRSTQPGDHDRSTQPGDHDRSTQPGDHDRSTQPGDHDRSTQPGDHDRSTQPGDHDRSTQPGDHGDDRAEVRRPRLAQEDATVDGVLCWDVLEQVDVAWGQALADELTRILRPGGALLVTFNTETRVARGHTKYEIVDRTTLRHRFCAGSRGQDRVLQSREVTRMFKRLAIADSFLLTHRMREMLFRQAGH